METVHKPRSYGQHTDHWLDFEESPRRVRVKFGEETLVDTRRAMLVREAGHVPVYYFPPDDVRMEFLTPNDHHTRCPVKGEASYWDVAAGGKTAESAAWSYLDPTAQSRDIAGYLSFYWNRMDAWYEEEDEIFVHARDPYKRVDVLNSSRHVQGDPRRRGGGGFHPAPAGARDRPPDALLPAARGRAHGPDGTQRHAVALSLQGHRQLLVGQREAASSSKTRSGATRTPSPNAPRSKT